MNNRNTAIVILALLLAAICLPSFSRGEEAVTGTAAAQTPAPFIAGSGKTAVALSDVSDPQSPYAADYRDWDRWAYAHAVTDAQLTAANAASRQAAYPLNSAQLTVEADADGYMLPLLTSLKRACDKDLPQAGWPPSDHMLNFTASGVMDPALREALSLAQMQLAAPYYATIPDWLAASPPIAARIMPDGSIVMQGAPGSGVPSGYPDQQFFAKGDFIVVDNMPWYMYSADGKQLSEVQAPCWYQDLFPGPQQAQSATPSLANDNWYHAACELIKPQGGNGFVFERGYWVGYKRRQVLAVYDFDGTPLPADFNYFGRDGNKTEEISAAEIVGLHAAQQELAH